MSAAERWREVQVTFERVLNATPAARARVLNSACDGDADLRREIETLLASRERMEGFLESSIVDIVGRM